MPVYNPKQPTVSVQVPVPTPVPNQTQQSPPTPFPAQKQPPSRPHSLLFPWSVPTPNSGQ